jgi:hypothetical protein
VILAAILDIAHWRAGWTPRQQAPGYPARV